ncbi:hypothetical protein JOM49_005349 [Amycolatopsis magusensis]|uniref:Iron-containing redox enzyme n=1 Tax=Amycolatopsis magusensis TaxID=882444 RepID=A0ABS4PWY7_9PSEU|nr:hypothetical protein [Amycolatopsis magusensis]
MTKQLDRPTASSRVTYAASMDSEAVIADPATLAALRTELTAFGPATSSTVEELAAEASRWTRATTGRLLQLPDMPGSPESARSLVEQAALAAAPLALVSGAWLQWLVAPGNAEQEQSIRALALYACDVGVGNAGLSRGNVFLGLLRRLRIADYAVPSSRIAADTRIGDDAFYLPAHLLAMSRHADHLGPEILGADFCLRVVGLQPVLVIVQRAHPDLVHWPTIDPSTSHIEGQDAAVDQARGIAALAGTRHERVVAGFWWALSCVKAWYHQLLPQLRQAADPAHEMARLLRRRAREGAVYHAEYRIGGRTLSDWLKHCDTDAEALLDALRSSPLVRPGEPEQSPLVTALVQQRGPMFRVFSPADLAIIRNWIASLPDHHASAPTTGDAPQLVPLATGSVPRARNGASGPITSLREAYHLLQTRTCPPHVHDYARTYTRSWLARSEHGIQQDGSPLPESWTAAGLRGWLVEQHDRHADEFDKNEHRAIPAREAVIESAVQQAPLTLIDGAWLQGFTDYEHACSQVGNPLFNTFWDELGNGEVELNHPVIYRGVLHEMGVELPPTGSKEFAAFPRFKESSFELPVYWLSVGKFPRTHLPELLGLNLAMELSGVGGNYRRGRIILREYGFSTRFVDIHNTIDNVATGHSAWAADAIDNYMAVLASNQPDAARRDAWHRIKVGFRSLTPPDDRAARRAGKRAAAVR